MHDVAVAFNNAVRRDAHRACCRHAAQVVAGQVHQHHVLGVFFHVCQQAGLVFEVRSDIRAARARASDGAQLRATVLQFHERLGRRAHHLQARNVQIEHVRRRVNKAQRTIGLERVHRVLAGETHGQHQLVDVASGNPFLHLGHAFQEFRLRQAGRRRAHLGGRAAGVQATAQRTNDLLAQRLTLFLGPGVQQSHAAGDVVEHQEALRGDPAALGDRHRILAGGQALEATDEVVGGKADQTARERYAGHFGQRARRLLQGGAQSVQQFRLGGRRRAGNAVDREAGRVEAHFQAVPEADEGIAGDTLTAFHAFQQETRPEGPQLQEGGNGRVEVGRDVERRPAKRLGSRIRGGRGGGHKLLFGSFRHRGADNKKPTPGLAEMGSGVR